MRDRLRLVSRFAWCVLTVLCGCVTTPSARLIEDIVEGENERVTEGFGAENKSARKKTGKATTKRSRAMSMVGKVFEACIYETRGEAGLARVENVEVTLPPAKMGDRVRLKITRLSPSGLTVFGEIVQVLGSADVPAKPGGVRPGQKYALEIIGITPSGDRYGLIGGAKAYVLGASHVGERLTALILGEDTLERGEPVYYAKKTLP